ASGVALASAAPGERPGLQIVGNPTRENGLIMHLNLFAGTANGHLRGIPKARRRVPTHGALHPGLSKQGCLDPDGRPLAELAREGKGANAAASRNSCPPPPCDAGLG